MRSSSRTIGQWLCSTIGFGLILAPPSRAHANAVVTLSVENNYSNLPATWAVFEQTTYTNVGPNTTSSGLAAIEIEVTPQRQRPVPSTAHAHGNAVVTLSVENNYSNLPATWAVFEQTSYTDVGPNTTAAGWPVLKLM